mmetsp:Transcript_19848/g.61430  ORF Transcript_19848/g.61430 Transcript_19848/m.61430 type:complete len:379 (+) Transcript_19848:26-1162(+)
MLHWSMLLLRLALLIPWCALAETVPYPAPAQTHENTCRDDASLPLVDVTILTTLPPLPSWQKNASSPHVVEILAALGENARTPRVEEIRVLLDVAPPKTKKRALHTNETDERATADLRKEVRDGQRRVRERLDALATDEELRKITSHVVGFQPTYSELFRYASYALAGRLVILMNADVVLRNLHLLEGTAFDEKLAMVLTVRTPKSLNFQKHCERPVQDRCVGWTSAGKSYDGFVFKSPLPATVRWDMLEEFAPYPVYMNEAGAENRAKQFLTASGYTLVNPCLHHLAEHWHCRRKMHHQDTRVDVKNHKNIVVRLGGWPIVPVSSNTRGLRCNDEFDKVGANGTVLVAGSAAVSSSEGGGPRRDRVRRFRGGGASPT